MKNNTVSLSLLQVEIRADCNSEFKMSNWKKFIKSELFSIFLFLCYLVKLNGKSILFKICLTQLLILRHFLYHKKILNVRSIYLNVYKKIRPLAKLSLGFARSKQALWDNIWPLVGLKEPLYLALMMTSVNRRSPSSEYITSIESISLQYSASTNRMLCISIQFL